MRCCHATVVASAKCSGKEPPWLFQLEEGVVGILNLVLLVFDSVDCPDHLLTCHDESQLSVMMYVHREQRSKNGHD